MFYIIFLLNIILEAVWWIIIIQAVMSWLFAFDIVNSRNRFVWQVFDTLTKLTEPLLAPIRRFIPPINGLDLAPIVLLIGISLIKMALIRNAYAFM